MPQASALALAQPRWCFNRRENAMPLHSAVIGAVAIAATAATLANAAPPATPDARTRAAILATCHDNIDGQLEGDPDRVARSLHPDVVMRAVSGATPHERFALETESREAVITSTRKGELKTPVGQWKRSCRILDVAGNAATVRLDTPWFVSYDQLGNFDGKWLIVNSFWYYKPKAPAPR
jgi:hypothetical protein